MKIAKIKRWFVMPFIKFIWFIQFILLLLTWKKKLTNVNRIYEYKNKCEKELLKSEIERNKDKILINTSKIEAITFILEGK
jgi:hypothetical protein